jgi:hypothetical protein
VVAVLAEGGVAVSAKKISKQERKEAKKRKREKNGHEHDKTGMFVVLRSVLDDGLVDGL